MSDDGHTRTISLCRKTIMDSFPLELLVVETRSSLCTVDSLNLNARYWDIDVTVGAMENDAGVDVAAGCVRENCEE